MTNKTDGGRPGSGVLGPCLLVWLVPLAVGAWAGLLTAQAGRLSVPVVAAAAVLSLAVVMVAAAGVARKPRGSWRRPHWADLATLALIAFAATRLWPAATPWPAFLDASWYVSAGARIADDGGLSFDPLPLNVAGEGTDARRQLVTTFLDQSEVGLPVPADDAQGFHDVAFAVPDVSEPETVPYHPPFLSTWLAVWSRLRGVLRTGEGVLPWSVAYLLAAAALARIAFGPVAALAAVSLLAMGPAFAYYGRTPFAEIPAGALALAGLAALSAVAARRDAPQPLLAALGGLGIGLAALAKAELVLLVPVVLVWWILARRKSGSVAEAVGLAIGLALPLANAAVLALTTTSLYVTLNGGGVLALLEPQLPAVLIVAAVAVAAVVGFEVLRRRHRRDAGSSVASPNDVSRADSPRSDGTRSTGPPPDESPAAASRTDASPAASSPAAASFWDDPGAVLRRGAAVAVLVALALVMARSWLASAGGPPPVAAILSWLVTPLGMWAGAAGLAMALEDGRARTGPLIAVALLAVPAILLAPAITETLSPLYTARRLVPFVLPVLAVFAGALVARAVALWPASEEEPDRQGRAYALAALAGTALVLFSLYAAAGPFYRVRSFGGGAALTRSLAGYGSPNDIFLFASILDGSAAGRMAAPLWAMEGRQTAVIGSVDADLSPLSQAVDGWIAEGRTVLLLNDPELDPPYIPGYDAEYIDRESIVTRALAPTPLLPATWRPVEISVAVNELVPAPDSR